MIVTYDQKLRFEAKKKCLEKANEVYELLYEDENRECDSKFGELAEYIDGSGPVTLTDIGSAINPNSIHVEFLKWLNEHLLPEGTLFKDPKKFNEQTIIQYWEDTGVHLNLVEGYKDYFEESVIKEYMTPYTYFNVNLTYEYVLQKLFKERTGNDTNARKFHDGITALLVAKEFIYTNEILENWFTSDLLYPKLKSLGLWHEDFEKMFPVLNVDPQLNINFVKPEILKALLSYDAFGFADPLVKADQLLQMREDPDKKGLTFSDLKNIIGMGLKYPGFRIYYSYLGSMTNFWELKAREPVGGDTFVLRWVIARIPKIRKTDKLEYKIIEEEFYLERKEPESEPAEESATEEEAVPEEVQDESAAGGSD